MDGFVVNGEHIGRMADLGMTRAQITHILGCSYRSLTETISDPFVLDRLVVNGQQAKKRYKRCGCCPHQSRGE